MTNPASPGFVATVFVAAEELAAPAAEIAGEAYRHLFRARRLAVGDLLKAVDGRGGARLARVAAIDRRTARLELGRALETSEPRLRLTLLVAAPRPERASWLIEKATELGVAAVRWLESERAPRKPGSATLERHRRVALAAMQQCGGALLPEISGPHAWEDLEALLTPVDATCVLDLEGGSMPRPTAPGSAAMVVGPEGGWTALERQRFASLGCGSWSLGGRVLRVETAALVAAATLLQAARRGTDD